MSILVQFSTSSTYRQGTEVGNKISVWFWTVQKSVKAHGECVKLCLYLNGTQISEQKSILYFIGINIFGLKSYTMPGNTHGVEDWKSEEWETLFEMEDVLNCTKILKTQANYETAFTSAFRPLIQHTLINSIY